MSPAVLSWLWGSSLVGANAVWDIIQACLQDFVQVSTMTSLNDGLYINLNKPPLLRCFWPWYLSQQQNETGTPKTPKCLPFDHVVTLMPNVHPQYLTLHLSAWFDGNESKTQKIKSTRVFLTFDCGVALHTHTHTPQSQTRVEVPLRRNSQWKEILKTHVIHGR